MNWAHYLIADGGALLDPLDNVITAATRAMYDSVFTLWIGGNVDQQLEPAFFGSMSVDQAIQQAQDEGTAALQRTK